MKNTRVYKEKQYLIFKYEDGSDLTRIWNAKPNKTEFNSWVCNEDGRRYEILDVYYLINVSDNSEPTLIKDLICNLKNEIEMRMQEIKK